MTREPVISAAGLGRRYRSRWALRDCTLSLPAGHVIGLVGPNGAGNRIKLSCLAAKGFHLSQIFQPAARYWPLQAVCTIILTCAAAILLAVAAWWSARQAA